MEGIAGPWMDRRTGKTVMVRDAIQDGDDLVIMSSVGQIPTDVFQNYFVQVSEEEYSASSQGVSKEVTGTQLLQQVNSGLEEGLKISATVEKPTITLDTPIGGRSEPISKPNKQQSTVAPEVKNEPKIEIENNNTILIKKVFDKHNIEPTVDFGIDITEWPVDQLKMLINVFDISIEEICDYVIKHYLNEEMLRKNLSQYFTEEIK